MSTFFAFRLFGNELFLLSSWPFYPLAKSRCLLVVWSDKTFCPVFIKRYAFFWNSCATSKFCICDVWLMSAVFGCWPGNLRAISPGIDEIYWPLFKCILDEFICICCPISVWFIAEFGWLWWPDFVIIELLWESYWRFCEWLDWAIMLPVTIVLLVWLGPWLPILVWFETVDGFAIMETY